MALVFLEERQQYSHLRCPGILGLAAIAQVHISTVVLSGEGEGLLRFLKKDSSTTIYIVHVYFSGWPPLLKCTF